MAEFVARAQEMILDLDDPSMVIVNDEILTNFLFFQSYQVNKILKIVSEKFFLLSPMWRPALAL